MNDITSLAQMLSVISAGRREPIHGGFAAASLLLRPAEITDSTCAFNLRALNTVTRFLRLNNKGQSICQ